jgi:hypothetical protein
MWFSFSWASMKISILDDYFDTLRTLACFHKLDGHEVTGERFDILGVIVPDQFADGFEQILAYWRTPRRWC